MRAGSEYLSSNSGIAYPFDESLRGTPVGDRIMDVFVDAYAWIGPRWHSRNIRRMFLSRFAWSPSNRQYLLSVMFLRDDGMLGFETGTGGTLSALPGSPFAVVSLDDRGIGASFTLDMDRLSLLSTIYMPNIAAPFAPCVVDLQGPVVRSFSIYRAVGPDEVVRTATGITGDVAIVGGNNITVRASPSVAGGVQLDAEPGAGTGRVPCECSDEESSSVSSARFLEPEPEAPAPAPFVPPEAIRQGRFSLHIKSLFDSLPARAAAASEPADEDGAGNLNSNDDPGWDDWSNDRPWSEQADVGTYPEREIDPSQFSPQTPADPYNGLSAKTNVVPGPAGEVVIGSDSCYGISADLEYGVVKIEGRCTACCQCDDYVGVAEELKDRNSRLTVLFDEVAKTADEYGEKAQEFNHSLQEVAEDEFAVSSSGSMSFGTNTASKGVVGTLARVSYSIAAVNASKFEAEVSVSDISVDGMKLENATYTAPSENGPRVEEDSGASMKTFKLPPGTSLRILARFVKQTMVGKPDTSAHASCKARFSGVNGHGAAFTFNKSSEVDISSEA